MKIKAKEKIAKKRVLRFLKAFRSKEAKRPLVHKLTNAMLIL
jgi:hypothetical protein